MTEDVRVLHLSHTVPVPGEFPGESIDKEYIDFDITPKTTGMTNMRLFAERDLAPYDLVRDSNIEPIRRRTVQDIVEIGFIIKIELGKVRHAKHLHGTYADVPPEEDDEDRQQPYSLL